MRANHAAILIALALLLNAGAVLADDGGQDHEKTQAKDHEKDSEKDREKGDGHHGEARFEKSGSKWILHDDNVAVWFHQGRNGDAKPDVRVVLNGTSNESAGYRVEVLSLCEVAANGTECGHDLPRLNLARMDDWNVVTEQTNATLTLTMVRSEAQAIITLVWHVDKQTAAVKFDVKVDNWRWANASDRLMLDTHVVGKNLKNSTGASVSVEDSGYIQWATSATANFGPNDTRTLAVDAMMKNDKADDENEHDADENEHEHAERANGGGHLLLFFNGSGGAKTISYDPTLGVASAGGATGVSLVPAAGLLAGALAVGAAALVLRKRRG